jgi:hypothetical protein
LPHGCAGTADIVAMVDAAAVNDLLAERSPGLSPRELSDIFGVNEDVLHEVLVSHSRVMGWHFDGKRWSSPSSLFSRRAGRK